MSSANTVELTTGDFAAAVRATEDGAPLLVDFWAPWCGPCRALGPVIEEIAGELGAAVKVAKVNIDDNPDVAAQFGIRSIPTLLFFKGGALAGRITGVKAKAEILAEFGI
jgi:thioredoxin 1